MSTAEISNNTWNSYQTSYTLCEITLIIMICIMYKICPVSFIFDFFLASSRLSLWLCVIDTFDCKVMKMMHTYIVINKCKTFSNEINNNSITYRLQYEQKLYYYFADLKSVVRALSMLRFGASVLGSNSSSRIFNRLFKSTHIWIGTWLNYY